MSTKHARQVATIFELLQTLRSSVYALEKVEEKEVGALRGCQTVDTDEAIHLSSAKLHRLISKMEELLATIAEATGEIPKFTDSQ